MEAVKGGTIGDTDHAESAFPAGQEAFNLPATMDAIRIEFAPIPTPEAIARQKLL